jgi:hypothetical protein
MMEVLREQRCKISRSREDGEDNAQLCALGGVMVIAIHGAGASATGCDRPANETGRLSDLGNIQQ